MPPPPAIGRCQLLRAARLRRSRRVLLFGHHPLFTQAPDEPDSYWNIPVERRRPILDLLKAHGVRAFFCGHWHRNGGVISPLTKSGFIDSV